MIYFYLKSVLFFTFTVLILSNASPLFAFDSLDEDDHRGNYDAAHYTAKLKNGTDLTVEIVEDWLKKTSIFHEDEKENLTVSVPSIKDGTQSQQVFFVNSKTQDCVIKVWAPGMFKGETENKARNTHAVKSAEYVNVFNNDLKYPSLTADIWGGFYKDIDGTPHYLHLMPKAQGIQLNEYLETNPDDGARLELATRIGEVFGCAHAYNATLGDEEIDIYEPWTLFGHGDAKPANMFIDFSSSPAKVTLIDLDLAGINLRKQPYQSNLLPPGADIGYILTHFANSGQILATEQNCVMIDRMSALINAYSKQFNERKSKVSKALLIYCGQKAYRLYNEQLPLQKYITDVPDAMYVRLLSPEKVVENLKYLGKSLGHEDEFESLHIQMQKCNF